MILHDPVSARVFNSERYSDIKGSPFLFEKWLPGSAIIADGVYHNLELKIDIYSNVVYFSKSGEPYEFADDVKSFVLKPVHSDSSGYLYFKKGISGANIQQNQYVQVLVDGSISIYKLDSKLLTDVNEINRGIVRSFTNSTRYFVYKDGQLQTIKFSKKEVLELVKDKEEKVLAYIEQNKLSTKKESDLILVLKYYNTL